MDREKTIAAVAVALVVVVLLLGGLAVVFIWGLSPVAMFRTASSGSSGSVTVVAATAVSSFAHAPYRINPDSSDPRGGNGRVTAIQTSRLPTGGSDKAGTVLLDVIAAWQ